MIKIKTIKINGIRGIKDTLSLNPDKRSVLIYGDNGSGKSSITDALEWFYKDKVGHLSKAEIAKNSIRNVFIKDEEDSKVDIRFTDNKLDTEKSIGHSLRSFTTNNSKEFYNYLTKSQSENIILRYSDLIEFITATKGDKLSYLQSIIGFNEVREIRGLLKKFAGRYAKDIKAGNYSNKKSVQQSIMMESLGQNIVSENQFFETTTKLIKTLNIDSEARTLQDIREILKTLETKEETPLIEKINFNNRIADGITEVGSEIDNIIKLYNSYYTSYTELRKDAEKTKKLRLLALLTEGVNVLKGEVIKEDLCPLCQQEKKKAELIFELNQRIDELKEIQREKKTLEEQADGLKRILQNNLNTLNGLLKEKSLKDTENAQILNTITDLRNSINIILEELGKDIFSEESIKEGIQIEIDKTPYRNLVVECRKTVKEITDSIKGNKKLQVHTKLSRAIDAYINLKKIEKEHELLINQQITFEQLYADFIKRQEEALNTFLNMFSGEINKYYTLMNPNEKVEDITLVPMLDKNDDLDGITISYKFYNKKHSPPTGLLSESHINCLGLAFFLASVKAFNKVNDFFLLDDVISSFDGKHRTRFIRLLTEEFSDFQIILMTHEKDFFDIACSEVKSKNWSIKSLFWSAEKGTNFETPLTDLRTKIEEKLKNKVEDGLGNDIRKYSERQLKQIANNIEADLPFRFNNRNEERMMNELLSGIQSKINKYSANDLKQKNNINSLLASPLLLSNKTAHDNTFKENINDLEVFWEDVKKLILTFYCYEDNCKSFISVKNIDTVKHQIRCNCGKVCYDWKK